MGVVVVQSKPVAQVYRLFGALVALLLVMAIGFSIARWRAAQSDGSPYGGLTPVAGAVVPVIASPARMAAVPATPPSEPAPTAAAAAPAITEQPAAAAMSPAPALAPATAASAVATAQAPVEAARAQPRMIALEKSAAGSVPLPAPAAAVAAATAAQLAAPKPAAPTAVASATPAADAGQPDGMININTASAEMLDHLPGVGRIGKTIVRHRPYGSVEDLVSHRVLKASDFARIRSHLTAN